MQIRGEGTYWPEAGGEEPHPVPFAPLPPGSGGRAPQPPAAPVGGAGPDPVAGVWRFALAAVDASVPLARHTVRDLLTAQGIQGPACDEIVQSLLLIVSELVTNAVRHAALLSPQIVVEVVIGADWVRVSVEDSHPYRPSALQNDFGRTGGRGLLLVRAMALESGGGCDVERTVGGGKVVWAALPLRPPTGPGEPEPFATTGPR